MRLRETCWTRVVLCALLTLGIASVSFAQEGGVDSYDAALEAFFGQLEEGEYAKALEGLYATNPWLQANRDQVTTLKNQFMGLSSLLGSYLGHERLIVQPVGSRFVYVWELAYFDREPLQFHFTFYKAEDKWQLWTISYDEDADVTAKEIARRKLAAE